MSARPLTDAAELYPENGALNCIAGALLVETNQPERAIERLAVVEKRLGDLSQRLGASVGHEIGRAHV